MPMRPSLIDRVAEQAGVAAARARWRAARISDTRPMLRVVLRG